MYFLRCDVLGKREIEHRILRSWVGQVNHKTQQNVVSNASMHYMLWNSAGDSWAQPVDKLWADYC